MIEIDRSRRSAPRSWIVGLECASGAASLLFHAAAFGGFVAVSWYWGESLLETTRFAGRQRVVHLQSQWAPDSPPPATEEESAVQVVVEPTAARIEHHHFRQVTAAEVVLAPLFEVGEPAVTEPSESEAKTERSEAPHEAPALDEPQPRPIPKAPSSVAPSIAQAAAVPQVLGTESKTPPRFFNNRPPNYPDVARLRGWQGTVLLDLKIDLDGQVTSVTVRESSGFALLDAEAVAAVRQWRAEPAKRGGRPVATDEILPVRFVLR